MENITIFQAITLAIAVIGAILGVINTLHGLDMSRIKLKVIPKHAIPFGGVDKRLRFCIEIINLSAFPITVSETGVFFYGTNRRGCIVTPVFADNGHWPRRLEPRASVTVYSLIPESENGEKIRCAYAQTQCGYIKTGSSPALRQISREV
ncbi:MAG: hypothetical protein WC357_06935 [Candidatus Omnitrophota bacterium]|jgi:hypothetical protein